MWGYDGQTFETWGDLVAYVMEKFAESGTGSANVCRIDGYGCDLLGQEVYKNNVIYAGNIKMKLDAVGLGGNDALQQLVNRTEKYYAMIDDVKAAKTSSETVIGNSTYINGSVQLGTQEAQGGQVLTTTRTMVTDNGTVQNQPNVMTLEEVEDPTVPGTFSYLATLKALGWLPLPAWTAAVAPLLGVGLGVGLYDLNPDFWEKVSRTLLPFAYDDEGVSKMPFSVDENGNTYTSSEAIEALRQLLIEEGAFVNGYEVTPSAIAYGKSQSTTADWDNMTITGANGSTIAVRTGSLTYTIDVGEGSAEASVLYYPNSNRTIVVLASKNPFTCRLNTGGFPPPYTSAQSATVNGESGYAHSIILSSEKFYSPASNVGSLSCSSYNVNRESYIIDGMIYAMYTAISGTGVEGTDIESGAVYPTDTTKNLAEIYPQWAGNGISVITDPTASTVSDMTTDWYPVSFSNTNYSNSTDNAYSTDTQAQAQTGTNTNQTQIDQIIEGLQDVIETLTRTGDLPVDPTVPTDPSGDTPSPTPPVITGAGSDLISIYNPTKAQIQAFNQFLWDLDPTNLVNWQKVIQNPIDAIISLHMIYVTPITGSPQHIKCGYIETDVSSKIVTNQYVDIDCGTVDISEYFHNVWDYLATDIQIYLPFIGIAPLHVGDVMNSTVRVKYRVDVYTGTCLAQIIVYKENSFAVLYTYTGNCAVSLPLSGSSFSNIMSTLIVMGGLVLSGNPGTAATYALGKASRGELKQHIQRSGNIGANAGAMGIRTPYLIITRKKPLDAYLYQEQYGFPANKTVVLGDMSGYTRVKNIHLHGIPCTDDELEMIERLLKDGVIIN